MTTVAVFNHKSGVGKTAITWHLAHALARNNVPVLLVDADPQANLTTTLYDDDTVRTFWEQNNTIYTVGNDTPHGL